MSYGQRFAALGLMSVLAVGSVATTMVLPTPAIAKPAANKTIVSSGQFQSGAHTTKGRAKVISKNGKYYLKLNQAFKTDSGPDLFVVLHKSRTPKTYTSDNYVSLGRLQSIEGTQVYEIPPSVKDPSIYESVVVWCKEFNVTFGHANLDS